MHEAVSGGCVGVSVHPIATASLSCRACRTSFLLVPAVLALPSLPSLAPVAHSTRPLVIIVRQEASPAANDQLLARIDYILPLETLFCALEDGRGCLGPRGRVADNA